MKRTFGSRPGTLSHKIRNFDAWLYFKFWNFCADHRIFGHRWLAIPEESIREWVSYVVPKTKKRKIEEIDSIIGDCKKLRLELMGGKL